MFYHETFDPIQLVIRETAIARHAHGIEPELSFPLVATHVDMHGFVTVTRIKEEPVRSDPQDGRHDDMHTCPSRDVT